MGSSKVVKVCYTSDFIWVGGGRVSLSSVYMDQFDYLIELSSCFVLPHSSLGHQVLQKQ